MAAVEVAAAAGVAGRLGRDHQGAHGQGQQEHDHQATQREQRLGQGDRGSSTGRRRRGRARPGASGSTTWHVAGLVAGVHVPMLPAPTPGWDIGPPRTGDAMWSRGDPDRPWFGTRHEPGTDVGAGRPGSSLVRGVGRAVVPQPLGAAGTLVGCRCRAWPSRSDGCSAAATACSPRSVTGASAQVFLADDVRLNRRVAVKVLHDALADDQEFLRRFRAEAQAAAALNHPPRRRRLRLGPGRRRDPVHRHRVPRRGQPPGPARPRATA